MGSHRVGHDWSDLAAAGISLEPPQRLKNNFQKVKNNLFLVAKNLPASVGDEGDLGSIPGWGRSPGGENGNPPQYSRLGNPMDRGAWWIIVHEIAKSQTWLSDWAHTHKTFWTILNNKVSKKMLKTWVSFTYKKITSPTLFVSFHRWENQYDGSAASEGTASRNWMFYKQTNKQEC